MTRAPLLVRLKKRADFLFVRGGHSIRRNTLVLQTRKNPSRAPDIGYGITATKKIGNAVVRNRAKRRLRVLAKTHLSRSGQTGHDYVLIARRDTAKCSWSHLVDDMDIALLRLSRTQCNNKASK